MRDILTILAGLVIVVLVAALAVPPLVDWTARRALFDAAITRAAGIRAATEGTIEVRLLPSPRLRIERLRLGSEAPEAASIDARFVKAEIALTPLLHGEVRFLESRIGRMELKLPTGADGDWRVPGRLVSDERLGRAWVFDDLAVTQLLLTTVEPSTGRTDQAYAEGVRIQAQSLAGPWRLDGTYAGTPFSLATGRLGPDLAAGVKITTGGDGRPRLSVDSRLQLAPGEGNAFVPSLAGTVRLTAGAGDDTPLPILATAAFTASGQQAVLDTVSIEAGETGGGLRLAGTGRIDLAEPRLSLALEGRRLDLDSGGDSGTLLDRLRRWRPAVGLTTDIAIKLDGVALGGQDLSAVAASGTLADGHLTVTELSLAAPGPTLVTASGDVSLGIGGGASGRIAVSAKAGDGLASIATRLGLDPAFGRLLDGRPVEASADVTAAYPVTSLRNLRARLGEATLSGSFRYTAAIDGARPRIDAQMALQNVDLGAASGPSLLAATRDVDIGLILDARNVGYGPGEKGGRIAARITSEGSAIRIERLEIADVAGANASLSGSVAPDGAGRIAGRVTGRSAGPLIDLAGRVWLGEAADLLPGFLRNGALDLAVAAERVAGTSAPALRTRLDGSVGAAKVEAEIVSADAKTRSLVATLSTDRTGAWLNRPDAPGLTRPSRFRLAGSRDPAGRLAFQVTGDLAGLGVQTRSPVTLTKDEDGIESGAVDLSATDLAPALAAFGQPATGPVAVALKADFARPLGIPRVTLAGRVAGTSLEADLSGPSLRDLGGQASLGRLSLPWLLSSVLRPAEGGAAGGVWPAARFGIAGPLPLGGAIAVRAAVLDLGRGLQAGDARFDLATVPEGIALRDLAAGFAGGQVTGAVTLTRQEGAASLIGEAGLQEVPLGVLAGAPFGTGRLSATLKFGGSGESAAGLVANLGGAGQVEIAGLQVPGADPAGLDRAASRALRTDDPLNARRLAGLVAEEIGRGPFDAGRIAGPATLVGGAIRVAPVIAETPAGSWAGAAGFDLKTLEIDLRGAFASRSRPRGWTGPAPYVTLGWTGPAAKPVRAIDAGPLANGLAAVVLARELDRIETFELDAAERTRRNARVEMDRARKAAAEDAARQARLREQQEAERARADAERIIRELTPEPPRPEAGRPPVPERRPAAPPSGG